MILENKIIITNEEWQQIFDSIWEASKGLEYEDFGVIDFKEHKYYFPGYFVDSISDYIYKKDNQSEYLDEDEIDEESFCNWCRTMLVRDDKTVWYFYILECGSISSDIDYMCGEEYIELGDNSEIPEEIKEIIEKI